MSIMLPEADGVAGNCKGVPDTLSVGSAEFTASSPMAMDVATP